MEVVTVLQGVISHHYIPKHLKYSSHGTRGQRQHLHQLYILPVFRATLCSPARLSLNIKARFSFDAWWKHIFALAVLPSFLPPPYAFCLHFQADSLDASLWCLCLCLLPFCVWWNNIYNSNVGRSAADGRTFPTLDRSLTWQLFPCSLSATQGAHGEASLEDEGQAPNPIENAMNGLIKSKSFHWYFRPANTGGQEKMRSKVLCAIFGNLHSLLFLPLFPLWWNFQNKTSTEPLTPSFPGPLYRVWAGTCYCVRHRGNKTIPQSN